MSVNNRYIDIVDGPIDPIALLEKVADPDVGAHGWFYGVTRRTTNKGESSETLVTQTLAYEAHRVMANRELEKLADRAINQFDLRHVVIVHRIGEVPIGEASVVVGCSSSHRPATFDALRWIMEVLKQEVPIWKRETYADGSTEWVHPIESRDEPNERDEETA